MLTVASSSSIDAHVRGDHYQRIWNFHLSVCQNLPYEPQYPYRGIRDHTALLERQTQEYLNYLNRGGVLNEYDMTMTDLGEEEYVHAK